MQMNVDQPGGRPKDQAPASSDNEEEPIVLGPNKARGGSSNRMSSRVLLISLTLTAALFAIGYLLVI